MAVITLPPDFIEQTRLIFGDTLWADFLQAMEEESPVSIRLNPQKAKDWTVIEGEEVPWCRGGYLPMMNGPIRCMPLRFL